MTQPTFIIPYLRGLAAELSDRVQGALSLSEPRRNRPEGSEMYAATSYDVLEGETVLGTVQINTYTELGTTTVINLSYEGRIPGYDAQPKKGNITMQASATDPYQLSKNLLFAENGKPIQPVLYRVDGHPLRFLDRELVMTEDELKRQTRYLALRGEKLREYDWQKREKIFPQERIDLKIESPYLDKAFLDALRESLRRDPSQCENDDFDLRSRRKPKPPITFSDDDLRTLKSDDSLTDYLRTLEQEDPFEQYIKRFKFEDPDQR